MKVAHGLARVETRTMGREKRGNLTAGYVGHFFHPFANTRDSLELG